MVVSSQIKEEGKTHFLPQINKKILNFYFYHPFSTNLRFHGNNRMITVLMVDGTLRESNQKLIKIIF